MNKNLENLNLLQKFNHLRKTYYRAFTLLELLIVLLIIGILIAVSLYKYQSIQMAAHDTQARTNVRATLINSQGIYSLNKETFSTSQSSMLTALADSEGALTYLPITFTNNVPDPLGNNNSNEIFVNRENVSQLSMCAQSESGKFFCTRVNNSEPLLTSSSPSKKVTQFVSDGEHYSNSTGQSLPVAYCALGTTIDDTTQCVVPPPTYIHYANSQIENELTALPTTPLFANTNYILPSPDGTQLLHVASTQGSPGGTIITVSDIDGINPQDVFADSSPTDGWGYLEGVQWSPDGTKIVFAHSTTKSMGLTNYDIYLINANGSGSPINLTPVAGNQRYPSFSPDGNTIYYNALDAGNTNDFVIWKVSILGGARTQVTTQSNYNAGARDDWPQVFDGKLYYIHFSVGGAFELYRSDINGSNAENISHTQVSYNQSFARTGYTFSPDGTKIAFSSGLNTSNAIYTMNLDGTNLTQLSTTMDYASVPTFTPDATQVIYNCRPTVSDPYKLCLSDTSNTTPLAPAIFTNGSTTASMRPFFAGMHVGGGK